MAQQQLEVVGTVVEIQGEVQGTVDAQPVRTLAEGQPVYAGEHLQTGTDGQIVISLQNGIRFDMGRNDEAVLDEEVYGKDTDALRAEAVATRDEIQAAIARGEDPTEVGEAPAAGADAGGPGDAPGAEVVVARTGRFGEVEAGFETGARAPAGIQINLEEEGLENGAEAAQAPLTNNAPVTSSNAITVDETDQDTGLGLSAPTDVDGDALTITVTGLPTQGQITLADGTPIVNGQTLTAAELAGLQYDGPGAGYDGADVGDFTYTVDDGSNPPVAGSVDITVNAINDAPVTSSNAITVDETDQDTGLGLSAPTDVDGDALTITVTGLPTQGQITLVDGTPIVNGQTLTAAELVGLQYDGPGAGYDGADVGDFIYTVDDGSNPPVAGSVDITVNAINDAPVTSSNAITVDETDQDTGLGLSAPTDVDGDALTITVTGLPTQGQITLADGTPIVNGQTLTAAELAGLQYDGPGAGYDGADVGDFTYTVDDGSNPPVAGSVDITVNAINDAPVTSSNAITVDETDQDTGLGLSAPTDVDGDALTITVTGLPTQGQITLADGTPIVNGQTLTAAELAGLQYDGPGAGYDGADVGDFIYTVDDGSNPPVAGSVDITVNAINDAPVTSSNAITVDETDQDTGLGLSAPTDVDGDALTITVTGLPTQGQITLADGTPIVNGQTLTAAELAGLQYDGPGAGYDGADVGDFTYTVDDGSNPPVAGSVDITVNAINDAPVAVDDANTLTLGVATTVSGNVLGNDTDVDTPPAGLSVDAPGVYSGTYGTLTLNGDGSYDYDVDTAAVNAAMLGPTTGLVAHWTFESAGGGTVADNAPEGTSANTLNLNGNLLSGAGVVGNAVQLDGSNRITLGDSSDINLGTHAQRTIALHFNADDVSGRQVLYEEGGSVRGLNVYIDDGELYVGGWNTPGGESGWSGDWVNLGPVVAGEWNHVALVLDGGGSVTADALTGYLNGVAVGAVPGSQLWSHSGDVNLGGSEGTILYHDGASGAANLFSGLIDDARVYNNALSPGEVDELANPIVDLTDSFTYQATDGGNVSNVATLDIVIHQDTGSPIANTDTLFTLQNTGLTGVDLLANDELIDGATVSSFDATTTNGGSVSQNPDGTFDYTPASGFSGVDTFTYTLTDLDGETSTATVTINVNAPSVAPPVALDDTATLDLKASGSVAGNVLTNDSDPDTPAAGLSVDAPGVYNGSYGTLILNADGSYDYAIDNAAVAAGLEGPAAGLVARWSFESNTGGAVSDVAPSGSDANTLSLNGNSLTNGGKTGGAVILDGTSRLTLADSTDINLGTHDQRSIALHFNADDVTGRQVLFEEGGGTRGLNIYIDDGNLFVGGWNTPGGESGWAGDWLDLGPVTAGQWHHVALVLDGGAAVTPDALTGYLDGTRIGSVPGSQLWEHSGDTNLGGSDGGSQYHDGSSSASNHFSGLIDDARVYNGLLDDADVATLAALDGTLTDSFSYQASDGSNASNTATLDIELRQTDGLPDAVRDMRTTDEDVALNNIDVLGNDSLIDGAVITAFDATSANGGTVTQNPDGTFNYTPATDFFGTDTFTYTLTDADGQSDSATVTVTVNPVNDAPTVSGSAITVDETDQDTGLGLSAPTDVDGDALTITVTGLPTQGQITLADGTSIVNGQTLTAAELAGLQYDGPGAGYDGADVGDFTYTVDDGSNPPVAGSVDITVNAINDAPLLLSEGNSLAFTELARSMSGVDWSSLSSGSSADANGIHNANLTTVDSGSTLRITFVEEDAGYSNTLGYYLVDQDTGTFSSGAVVFANSNSVSTPVQEIDVPAGQTVGFFLIANGANRYGAQVAAVQGGSATFEMIDNAGIPTLTYVQGGTSQVLTEVYHSYDSALNPDGFVRVASGLADPAGDSLRIGFEDLPAARSDWDLRDLTIDVELVDTYLNGETLLPTLQVSDPDSEIVSANVNLSSAQPGDALAFDAGGDVSLVGGDVFILGADSGVDAVFDPAGDQLTLSGDATASTYEQILQAVAIDNASPTDPVARTVQVDVSDGAATTTLTTHLGTSLAETLSGGSGADVLNGAGGADNLLGGAGDDILVHDAIDVVVDGGSGSDTLIINGVSAGPTNVLNIERLDMQDLSGGDQLSLSLADVLNITDANDILFIDGDSGDQVTIDTGDGWVEQSLSPGDAGFRNGYTLYEAGAAKLYIEDQISVDLI